MSKYRFLNIFLAVTVLLGSVILSQQSQAQVPPCNDITETTCEVLNIPIISRKETEHYNLYSRLGQIVERRTDKNKFAYLNDINGSSLGSNAKARISCNGGVANGGWQPLASSIGYCWDEAFEFCFELLNDTNASTGLSEIATAKQPGGYLHGLSITSETPSPSDPNVVEVCWTIPAKEFNPNDPNDLSLTPYTHYSDIFIEGEKTYRAHDNQDRAGDGRTVIDGTRFVDGQTQSDDMFHVPASASGYIEYVNMGTILDANRLKFFQNNSIIEDYAVPAGPPRNVSATVTAHSDYVDFIAKGNVGDLSIEDACYPVQINMCNVDPKPKPPVDGYCGSLQGATIIDSDGDGNLVEEIEATGKSYCTLGLYDSSTFSINTTTKEVTWTCREISDEAGTPVLPANCTASYEEKVNGVCGAEHRKEYETFAEIDQTPSALCTSGNPLEFNQTSDSGPWFYTCKGIGQDSTDDGCKILDVTKTIDCDAIPPEDLATLEEAGICQGDPVILETIQDWTFTDSGIIGSDGSLGGGGRSYNATTYAATAFPAWEIVEDTNFAKKVRFNFERDANTSQQLLNTYPNTMATHSPNPNTQSGSLTYVFRPNETGQLLLFMVGRAELQDTGFEDMTFQLLEHDTGTVLFTASSTSNGDGLYETGQDFYMDGNGCVRNNGNGVQSCFQFVPPLHRNSFTTPVVMQNGSFPQIQSVEAGKDYRLVVTVNSNDALWHIDAFYEFQFSIYE